ncbi:4-(cytidine 5'-diphospho)-2-C-methyl-D-erythritol kinase [Candidatus Fokinia crypta]|uniref:4-diphosphocytidyl-2-C-methyl-D-erythritol kinase n=1 Tax=Candidatus Fokinia crypta TaxID=1920990 RepID=A0ABZ0UUD4_9RICK|nr:4-(cytidine 5'-diphospho)-2-C-methyl-D-erythritol kinase [Candidatus Fokinia cryptica]WPX97685.1 4-diphosphocytidyl-2-C-methyl-D-erythritol kinase [Candidatus Fokinia cryptica]
MDITKEYIVKSYAKLNLFLKIHDILPDEYHEVCTILTKINLHDTITITFDKTQNEFSSSSISMVSNTGQSIDTIQHNLVLDGVMEILKLLKIRYGIRHHSIEQISRMKIKINKKIPIGSGMGGGSSNVGTIMRFLYYHLKNLSIEDIVSISNKIGVDVAFFTHNYQCALGTHKGERLLKLRPYYHYYAVIVFPNFSCNTSYVYHNFSLTKTEKIHNEKILDMSSIPELRRDLIFNIGNDLENTAILLYPEISYILRIIASTSAIYYSMTGSGSACFGLFKNKREALLNAKKLQNTKDNWSIYVSKVNF